MVKAKVGISDIALYIPPARIELSTIVDQRVAENPAMDRKLRRAVESTGQKAIRFPAAWEDSTCLAANAAHTLLKRYTPASLATLRHLAVGTETTVDFSKPISAYVAGMLKQAGIELPGTISSFQVQHACAGGTIAMMSVAALLALSPRPEEKGLVICTDIARYEVPSTAEFTQGAGAAALLIEKNPSLLELDLSTQGYSSSDVDDFFRPLDSTTARVRGQYSMQCYHDAAEEAFADHAERVGKTPAEILSETDYFIFHVPFAKMAYTAVRHLLALHLGLMDGEIDTFLKPRGFFEALENTAETGNIYTGAAFLNLASMLLDRYKVEGNAIVGKKVLFSSYGSGNTMIVISATIAPDAPRIIAGWNQESLIGKPETVGFSRYAEWVTRGLDDYNERVSDLLIPQGTFYLKNFREDGYREYGIKN